MTRGSNDHKWIYHTKKAERYICSPFYKTEGELYSFLDKLMRYDEECGNTGEICTFEFLKIGNSRLPIGDTIYKYDVLLNTCEVKHRVLNESKTEEQWWAKFHITQKRVVWDVIPHERNDHFCET